MHVVKIVCYRYLCSLGPLWEAILAHFGQFCIPEWIEESLKDSPKTRLSVGYFLDKFWDHFGAYFGAQMSSKNVPKLEQFLEPSYAS